jgi:RNA polymerase sigma factor (sigma-70 family)
MIWRTLVQRFLWPGCRFATNTLSYSGDGFSESNTESFAASVTPHTMKMLHVAAVLVGVADAEDAAQEALLRAWQSWPQLRDPAAVRPWLLRITVNVCHQWLRGEMGKRKRQTLPLLDESVDWLASGEGDPGDSDHAAALDVRRALAHLKPDLRIVVVLHYYGGMETAEIGVALGIPPATVRSRLHRAYVQLRTHLDIAPNRPSMDIQEGHSHA